MNNEKWQEFRKLEKITKFGIIPMMIFFGLGVTVSIWFLPFLFIFLIVFSRSSKKISYFKCPKCGELFFKKQVGFMKVAVTRDKCAHCGLLKYEENFE